jgi:SAM-dependent methyltransferase
MATTVDTATVRHGRVVVRIRTSLGSVDVIYVHFDVGRLAPTCPDAPVVAPYIPAMYFRSGAEAYDRFMGRYSRPLAAALFDLVAARMGRLMLDVGCGPGTSTAAFAAATGRSGLVAVDPSPEFVAVMHDTLGLPAAVAAAERLPFADDTFDLTAAQLVVHFMADPVAGLADMGRVTKPGGAVVATVWDYEQGGAPLTCFWDAARDVDPNAPGEDMRHGTRSGQLRDLCERAGLVVDVDTKLTATVEHETFDEWWEPFTFGVGPAGVYVANLSDEDREKLRDRSRELLPAPPFTVTASAWTVVATVPQ